jgi:hypothetical protein
MLLDWICLPFIGVRAQF